jgi:hypothetical protein
MTGGDNELVLRSGDIAGEDPDARERVRRHARQMLVRLELLGDEKAERVDEAPGFAARPETPPTDFPVGAEPSSPRNLIIAIVTVPIVFVAVVILSVSVFGRPNAEAAATAGSPVAAAIDRIEQPSRHARAAEASFASSFEAIETPEDSRIASLALDGDHLAMLVESPAGAQVKIYDLSRGAMAAQVPIQKRVEETADAFAPLDQPRPRAALSPEPTQTLESSSPVETAAAPTVVAARAPRLKPQRRD